MQFLLGNQLKVKYYMSFLRESTTAEDNGDTHEDE